MTKDNKDFKPPQLSEEENKDRLNFLKSQGVRVGVESLEETTKQATSDILSADNPYALDQVYYAPTDMGFEDLYRRSAFKRLGFNPLIDNYKRYVDETTTWEKTKDSWKANARMHMDNFSFFGFGGQDNSTYAAAKRYEENASLGTPLGSSGMYDWALTQYTNAGYTMAIMSSIAAEEVTLALATTATGGGAGGALATTTARNAWRLSNIGRRVKTARTAFKSGAKLIKNLKDVGGARKFFNASKSTSGKFFTKTGEFLFPNATSFIKQVGSKGDDALEGFALLNHGFGSFYREIREFNLAFDESDLESSFVKQDVMSDLVDKYIENHDGKLPEGIELEKLQKLAQEAGDATFIANASLIYATNKIGFNSMFTRWSSKAATKVLGGRVVKFKANAKMGTKAKEEFVKDNFINSAKFNFKNIRKHPGLVAKRAGLSLLKGTSTGTSEGIQEYSQEVIGHAEKTFAINKYASAATGSKWDQYSKSFKKYQNKDGAEVFIAGFAMGMFAMPHKFLTTKGTDLAVKYAPHLNNTYEETEIRKEKQKQQMYERIKFMNKMFSNPNSKTTGLGSLIGENELDGLILEQAVAKEEGDKKKFKDIADDVSFTMLFNTINSGGYDILIDQMEQMQNLTNDEIKEMFPDALPNNPTEQDINKLKAESSLIVDRARYIKKSYEKSKEVLINPFDQNSKEVDTNFGFSENILYNAYEAARTKAIKNEYLFTETLKRKNSILEKFSTKQPFWKKDKTIPAQDLNLILNKETLNIEISFLNEELKGLNEADKKSMSVSQKKSIKDKTKKLELLKALQEDSTEFRKVLNAVQKESTKIKKNSKVSIKTKTGGEGTILGSAGTGINKKYKVKKDNGRVFYIKASNVELHEDAIGNQYDKAYDSKLKKHSKNYKNYISFLASTNDNMVDDAAATESFQEYIDYHVLTHDQNEMEVVANALTNPEYFYNEMLREAAIREKVWENKKEILEESLKMAQEAEDVSTLASILAEKHNAFLEEDDLLNLLKNEGFPVEYYDIDTLKPIDRNSKRYVEILAEIQKFTEERFERVENKTEFQIHDILTSSDFTSEEDLSEEIAEVVKKQKQLRTLKFMINQIENGTMDGDVKPLIEELQNIQDFTIYITKIKVRNADGTVDATISLNGKTFDVTLNALEKVKKSVVKETIAESDEKITIETPFAEWPKELQELLNNMMTETNEGLVKAELDPMTRVQFLESIVNKKSIQKLIDDFYEVSKKEDIVEKEEVEEVEVEIEDSAEESRKPTKKVTQMEFEMSGLSKQEKETIENEKSKDAEIEIKLDDVLLKSILDGETNFIATAITGELINEIILKLNESNPGLKIESLVLGQEVYLIVGEGKNRAKIDITFLYEMTAQELAEKAGFKTIAEVAVSIGAQTEAKGNYVIAVDLEGHTYFVKDNLQKLWLEGNGKLSILTAVHTKYDADAENYEAMTEATKEFETLLKESIAKIKKNPKDIKGILARLELSYMKLISSSHITPKLNDAEIQDFEYISNFISGLDNVVTQGVLKTKSQIKMDSIQLGLTYEFKLNGAIVHAVAISRINDVIGFEIDGKIYDVNKNNIMETVGEEIKGVPPASFDVSEIVTENDDVQDEITSQDVADITEKYNESSIEDIEDDIFDDLDNEQKNC